MKKGPAFTEGTTICLVGFTKGDKGWMQKVITANGGTNF